MATSVIAAVMSKLDSLTASGFPNSSVPPVYLDQAPQADGSGAQLRPPYMILRDGGQEPQREFERNTLEVCRFTLEVYYASLADVDAAVFAVKWNGGGVGGGQGLDYGTLSALSSPRSTHQVVRTRETRRLASLDYQGNRVHACELEYQVTVREASS